MSFFEGLFRPAAQANREPGLERALLIASRDGQTDIVEQLLAKGADINTVAANGLTPLMFATLEHRPAVVELLLSHGANVNAPSAGRMLVHGEEQDCVMTALMFASRDGHADLVEIMLAGGAKANLQFNSKGDSGHTALMLAS
jgi:ankyrin repeat protein